MRFLNSIKRHAATLISYIQVWSFVFFSVILFLADFSPSLNRRRAGPWRSEVTGLYEDDYSSSPSLTPLLPQQAYLSLEGQNGEEAVEENIVYLWKSLTRNDQCKLPDIKLDWQWYISVAFYVFVYVPVAPIVMWWLHIELRTECKGYSCWAEVSTDTVYVPLSVYVAAMNHFSSRVTKPLCLLAEKFFIKQLLYLYSPCFTSTIFFFIIFFSSCTCSMAEVLLCPKHWDLKLQEIRTEVCVAVIWALKRKYLRSQSSPSPKLCIECYVILINIYKELWAS